MRKNCSFESPIVFTCYIVEFIQMRFLFTHIVVVILTTKKDFFQRALLFLVMSHKAVLLLQKNEAMNVITEGQVVKMLPRARTVCFISQMKIKLMPD